MNIRLKDIAFGYVYPNGNTVGGPIIGRGYFSSSLTTYLDPTTGQGIPTIFHTFGGTAVEVEVDLVTGSIEVRRPSRSSTSVKRSTHSCSGCSSTEAS